MSKQTRFINPIYSLLPMEVEGFDSLAELALDMRWSWNYALAGSSGGYVYSAAVSAARPATDYTARVVPHCPGVAVPLEAAQILWER